MHHLQQSPAVVYRNDPDLAQVIARQHRNSLKEAVLMQLSRSALQSVRWSTAIFPTLIDIAHLCVTDLLHLPRMWVMTPNRWAQLVSNTSFPTAVELADGLWPAVIRTDHIPGIWSLSQLSTMFREQVLPAQLQVSSRKGYWSLWRSVVTWGIAHQSVHLLLPMDLDTLMALTQDFLITGCSASLIKNLFSAIEDRHHMFQLVPPLGQPLMFKRLFQAVASIKGTPARIRFPISKAYIHQLLMLTGLTPLQNRDVIMVCAGTVMSLRVSEVSQAQTCDALFAFDAAYDPQYIRSLMLHVWKRKQDTRRHGHFPRVAPANNRELDLVLRLQQYLESVNNIVSPLCTKLRFPAARCPYCPPLFLAFSSTADLKKNCSRQMVSSAVKRCMIMIGVDPLNFSGISMRRGGLSVAIHARVPEAILYIQSGHGKGSSARRYIVQSDPQVLFESSQAFGL